MGHLVTDRPKGLLPAVTALQTAARRLVSSSEELTDRFREHPAHAPGQGRAVMTAKRLPTRVGYRVMAGTATESSA